MSWSGFKKTEGLSLENKRALVDSSDTYLSIKGQCELLSLARSSLYYKPAEESEENLHLMKVIDEIHTKWPFYGSRRILTEVRCMGKEFNRKRIQRLMRVMGVETCYPKKRVRTGTDIHKVYPYLLNKFCPVSPNEVWCSDITYIPVKAGYFYLTAVMDWFSRYILSWSLSNSLDTEFCVEAIEKALERGIPRVFNTDQGVQYTSNRFTQTLLQHGVTISMDHQGRCFDNIFIERLWRSLKQEEVYLNDYIDGTDAYEGIRKYIMFYNEKRRHSALNRRTPEEVHFEKIR
jgi:putative transposase